MWLVIELKRDGGKHNVKRAADLVAKDIGKHFPAHSADRLRHLHGSVEKRRASDPDFEKQTTEALTLKKSRTRDAD
jgi:hypothetical protein